MIQKVYLKDRGLSRPRSLSCYPGFKSVGDWSKVKIKGELVWAKCTEIIEHGYAGHTVYVVQIVHT